MLKRIIETSSRPGDLVLDCFAGSGTTLVAAEELGRQWIGVDIGEEAISTIKNRFKNGSKPMGDYVKKSTKKQTTLNLFENEEPKVSVSTKKQKNISFDIYEEL